MGLEGTMTVYALLNVAFVILSAAKKSVFL